MNFKESKAIYLQIADRICDEVLLGQYQEEERIPSVREYAAVVEVNANTVMRSYDYLQTQGVIYNKRGIGLFCVGRCTQADSLVEERVFSEGGSWIISSSRFSRWASLPRSCPGCIRSLSRNKIKEDSYETNDLYNDRNAGYRCGNGMRTHVLCGGPQCHSER